LRHTMRDTHAHGVAHASTTFRPDVTTGLSAKSPRMIRNGLRLEEEDTNATVGDPFKERTVNPRDLPAYQKKHVQLNGNLVYEDPWYIASLQAPQDPTSAFRPLFTMHKMTGRPVHTLHKNNSHLKNTLPGPAVTRHTQAEAAQRALPQGAKWTHAILDYNHRMDPATSMARLEPDGREPVNPRKDQAPMYSSFSADSTFTPMYVGRGFETGRLGRPVEAERKSFRPEFAPKSPIRERESLYGEPAEVKDGNGIASDTSLSQFGQSLAQGSAPGVGASAGSGGSAGGSQQAHGGVRNGEQRVAQSPVKVSSAPSTSPSRPRVVQAGRVSRNTSMPSSPLVAQYPAQAALKFGFKAPSSANAGGMADSLASAAVRTGSFAR
jgi:hypothetical protein